MLRTKCCLVWRALCATFLLLGLGYSSSLLGGPLIGVAPKPNPTPPPPPTYVPPSQLLLSGYVYVDNTLSGTLVPGDPGISGVQLTLTQYAVSNPTVPIGSAIALTNASGYYQFNVAQDTLYTLSETQPVNYPVSHNNTLGHFVSATGGSLAAPTSPVGVTSVGQFSPNPNQSSDTIMDIYMPKTTTPGFGSTPSGGMYTLLGYNFGDYIAVPPPTGTGSIGKPPPKPGVPGNGTGVSAALSASLALTGTNNRFLAGPGAGTLNVTGAVSNPAAAGANSLNWQITAQSPGLSVLPTSATGVAAGTSSPLTGTISGTSFVFG